MEKLLFTGASGFLGDNIKHLLEKQYDVRTLGLSKTDSYNIDIRMPFELKHSFDIVLHAAGKAHVIPKNEIECQAFFDINYNGTKNLCESLNKAGLPKSFIFISSVAVYGRSEGENIHEDSPLEGNTPYALSKIKAEQYLIKWCQQHGVLLTILRPSLIAGPNAPGNLGGMVKGIKTGKYLSIGKGTARKSILMVQDIANLIPKLVEQEGVYNVCDDFHPTFRELEILISKQLNKNTPMTIPYRIAKGLAIIGDCLGKKAPINSDKLNKITQTLTFSNERAKKELDWLPLSVLENYKI